MPPRDEAASAATLRACRHAPAAPRCYYAVTPCRDFRSRVRAAPPPQLVATPTMFAAAAARRSPTPPIFAAFMPAGRFTLSLLFRVPPFSPPIIHFSSLYAIAPPCFSPFVDFALRRCQMPFSLFSMPTFRFAGVSFARHYDFFFHFFRHTRHFRRQLMPRADAAAAAAMP
jgi:hypothetical protein